MSPTTTSGSGSSGSSSATSLDGATLVEFVAGLLSHHKRPREVHVVDHLPRNAMGKVQKKQLAP